MSTWDYQSDVDASALSSEPPIDANVRRNARALRLAPSPFRFSRLAPASQRLVNDKTDYTDLFKQHNGYFCFIVILFMGCATCWFA